MKLIEEPQLTVKRKLPWFVDVFLYPISISGIIHIVIFWLSLLLLGLLDRFILSRVDLGGIISLWLYMLLIGYISYYFGYCIFDSSKGGRRAPDIAIVHTPDKGDLLSQLFLMLGCVAICFCPVAIYYAFTIRTDSTFWVLAGCGGFFFPMALLVGVLFDATHALNPIFIVGSILRSFFAYCGLILSFCLFGGLVVVIVRVLNRLPILGFISNIINLYLLFVSAHLLGRFYWLNKDRLDWGL